MGLLEFLFSFQRYVDDIPVVEGELFVGFVLSECAHATFSVDTSALEGMKVCLNCKSYCQFDFNIIGCKRICVS